MFVTGGVLPRRQRNEICQALRYRSEDGDMSQQEFIAEIASMVQEGECGLPDDIRRELEDGIWMCARGRLDQEHRFQTR